MLQKIWLKLAVKKYLLHLRQQKRLLENRFPLSIDNQDRHIPDLDHQLDCSSSETENSWFQASEWAKGLLHAVLNLAMFVDTNENRCNVNRERFLCDKLSEQVILGVKVC